MKLKLKENPREWQKLILVMVVAFSLGGYLLSRRGYLTRPMLSAVWILLGAVAVGAAIRPRWFRGFYRGVMTASFHVGQVMGCVLLALVFLLLLTPLGWLLRRMGKDLLQIKKKPSTDSYWHPVKSTAPLDRMF